MVFRNLFTRWRLWPYRKRSKVLASVDYALCHKAYEQYTLSIIDEPCDCLCFPVSDRPDVSIIIPVYNQYLYTKRCLQSLLDCTDDISYEIILVDDASDDETKSIEAKVRNILVLRNESNRGFLYNCNHAARFAKGRYLYFLNNDTQVFKKTVSSLAAKLNEDARLAIVGSKCIGSDSKLQFAGGLWLDGPRAVILGENENPLDERFNSFRHVDFCFGTSMMVRRDFWEKAGGFDPAFTPGYYEESDLCARALKSGFAVGYQPESEVIHFGSASFRSQAQLIWKRNKKKFYKKWKKGLPARSPDEVLKLFESS